MKWFPVLTLKLVKSVFPRVKTSGHIPQKIAQVSYYRLHKKFQRSLFLYQLFNHFSKFQIFEDFFLTPIKESERSKIAKRVLFG